MRRKDQRRHAKFWPNALKDHSIMLELRQGNAVDSKSKQSREPDPKKIGRSDRNLPDRIKLVGSDQVSRAAQRHGLKAMKLIPHFGPPYFEFNCANTDALVFRFSIKIIRVEKRYGQHDQQNTSIEEENCRRRKQQ